MLPDLVRLYLHSGYRMVVLVDKHLSLDYEVKAAEREFIGFDVDTARMKASNILDSNLKVVQERIARIVDFAAEENNYLVRNFFIHANNCLLSASDASMCKESGLTTPDKLTKCEFQPVSHLPIRCQEKQS